MSAEKEPTVLVVVGDRKVEMRRPTEGAVMVLALISKATPNGVVSEAERAKATRHIANLAMIIDEMIVQDDDRDWLAAQLITGALKPEDAMQGLVDCAKAFREEQTEAKPKAPVRRRPAARR